MQIFKFDIGVGDCFGFVQVFSEVFVGLGIIRFEEILFIIFQNVEFVKFVVWEGFMLLFIFLFVCFGNSFLNYFGCIIFFIFVGLVDDVEFICEIVFCVGCLFVKNFVVCVVDLLLFEFECGLVDDSYRICFSFVELVGDFLFNLIGVKVIVDGEEEEDEDIVCEIGIFFKEVFGVEKCDKIFLVLYVCCCDIVNVV